MGKAARLKRARQEEEQRKRNLTHSRGVVGLALVESQQQEQAVWPSPAQRAGSLALLEEFDGFARMRNGIKRIAGHIEEWAGIPMPIEGEELVVEPSYRKAAGLMAFGRKPEDEKDPGFKVRSCFYSRRHRCEIYILEYPDGRISWTYEPAVHHFKMDLQTLGCSDAWGIEQESNAVHTLARLVRHRQFKQYMLTGMFLERSQRSGIDYAFRRLKPTVAIRSEGDETRIMCALCLHPIAYYSGSWAGAMCPTDDVIAHLMLMRGDEPMFWKRSSQHPPHLPAAGL